jgi:hypothetical protein
MSRHLLPCLVMLIASTSMAFGQTDRTTRKASPTLAGLPAPKAGGALRILLVVDDWDRSKGSPIFRKLVADAVGGDAKAWSSVIVKPNEHGPSADKLRDFNVVVWYTGDSYGGGYNGISTLSDEDEKTARRYLQETGGAFILVSPGFLSTRSYGTNWQKSDNPFLKEVVGINGFADLVQRFSAGTVRTPGGETFAVQAKGTVETQFTAVNPDGAAVVLSATLDPAKTAQGPVPVAVAHAYGGGRFVYVGFSLENMAEAERAKAFGAVLTAAVPSSATSVVRSPAPIKQPAAGGDLGPFNVQLSGSPVRTSISWTLPSGSGVTNASLGTPQVTKKAAAAPAPGMTVVVERWTNTTWNYFAWVPLNVKPGASQTHDDYPAPGTVPRYRVTVTDAKGATASKEVEYTVPSPRDPESINAIRQSDGSVVVSWPEVPGMTAYRVENTGVNPSVHITPTVVNRATEWRSQPLDDAKRRWVVRSVYERDGQYISLTDDKVRPIATTIGPSQYYLVGGKYTIRTGNDNKEAPSRVTFKLYTNGGETRPEWLDNNPLKLSEIWTSFDTKGVELKVNSSANIEFDNRKGLDFNYLPWKGNLAYIQQHGLRLVIKYEPNFPLDAWRVDGVTMTLKFMDVEEYAFSRRTGREDFTPGMDNKTITFSGGPKLLTERDNELHLTTSPQPIRLP